MTAESRRTQAPLDRQGDDAQTLERFGYTQELSRRMSGFGSFAMSFMIIGVFGSACLNMNQGISTAGMFGVSVMWLVGSLIAFATAAYLGEISSEIPTAGGLYHWSSSLGGRGWGWATAWINLLAYVFSTAGAAAVFYIGVIQMLLGWILHVDTASWGYREQVIGVAITLASQAALNHVGVRLLSRVSEFGAYITIVGATFFVAILIANIHPLNWSHIFEFANNSGAVGGNTVPRTTNKFLIYGYALLLPMWIITGYDCSAHASEETIGAQRAVPRAMINSVLLSAAVGFFLLMALVMAMKDPAAIVAKGDHAFAALFDQIAAPGPVKSFTVIAMLVGQYICGACSVTGMSRAVFAFARDGGLPVPLRRVSTKFYTPATAIWSATLVAMFVTLFSSALAVLVAGTALFYQLCYGMAMVVALFAKGRRYGPFRLGAWSKPLGSLGVAGGIILLWVGLQPPTASLVWYFVIIFGLLIVGWFSWERKHFSGPPVSLSAAEDI